MRCSLGTACGSHFLGKWRNDRAALASHSAGNRDRDSLLCNAIDLPQSCHRSFRFINALISNSRSFHAMSRVVPKADLDYVAVQ
jgi:hypothetical protein